MWGTIKVSVIAFVLFFAPVSALAVSYTPTAGDLELLPGESSAVTFSFFHNEAESKDFYVQLVSARVGNGPDEIQFFPLDQDSGAWLSLSEAAFSLDPGEVREVTLSVTVPKDASNAVHVFALQVIERPDENDMIGATTGVSPLVFLSVGELPASANLSGFSSSTQVTDAIPVSFLVEIENTGLRVLQPQGQIVLRNMFGEVIDAIEVNPQRKRVTSEVVRSFEVNWGEARTEKDFFGALTHEISHFTIGWIKAELTVTPWEGGEQMSDSLTLFFFPWRTLLALVAVVAVLLGLFRVAKR